MGFLWACCEHSYQCGKTRLHDNRQNSDRGQACQAYFLKISRDIRPVWTGLHPESSDSSFKAAWHKLHKHTHRVGWTKLYNKKGQQGQCPSDLLKLAHTGSDRQRGVVYDNTKYWLVSFTNTAATTVMTYLALTQGKNMILDTGTNRAFPLPTKLGSLISH